MQFSGIYHQVNDSAQRGSCSVVAKSTFVRRQARVYFVQFEIVEWIDSKGVQKSNKKTREKLIESA